MAYVVVIATHIPVSVANRRLMQPHKLLSDQLARRADSLAKQYPEQAQSLYFRSLGFRPNNASLLRKLADLYQSSDATQNALLCRQGVIPEAANTRFYDGDLVESIRISVKDDQHSIHNKVYAPERVAMSEPEAFGRTGKFNQFRRKFTESRGSLVSTIPDGQMWFDGMNTLVMNRNLEIPVELAKGNVALAYHAASLREPVDLQGRVCFLDARSSSIYYHWMLDVLPKFHLLQRAGIDLNSIDHFVVRHTNRFQRDTLQALGISEDRCHWIDGGVHFRATELVIPTLKNDLGDRIYTGLGLGMASWVPDYLRETFVTDDIEHNGKLLPRRLFVSRDQAKSRRLINQSAAVAALAEYGFELFEPGSLSVKEQAALFNQAEIVVGCHGAGLTNLAFCQPGTQVLEIFGDYVVPCYWALSRLAGLKYARFMAEPTHDIEETGQQTVSTLRSEDIQIDIDQLRTAVSSLCSDT